MSLIADILPPANVVVDMVADGKRNLLEQIGALFEASTRLPRAKVVDSLLAREKLGSTAMARASRFLMDASRVCARRRGCSCVWPRHSLRRA